MKPTFKAFLEATGDAKFDKMMGAIKGRAEFHGKVQGVVDDAQSAFQDQKNLEKWLAAELEKVRAIPDKALQRHKAELAPLAKEYREDTNLLELLYFHASDLDPHGYKRAPENDHEESLQDLADSFMHRHGEDVQDAITSWLAGFSKLKAAAEEKKWPTGKGSFMHPQVSKFSSEYHHAKSIAQKLRHWAK